MGKVPSAHSSPTPPCRGHPTTRRRYLLVLARRSPGIWNRYCPLPSPRYVATSEYTTVLSETLARLTVNLSPGRFRA